MGVTGAVSFKEALGVWAKIGVLSFGGPAGQIALMHRIIVDEKRWLSEERFLHALNFCTLLPGPEAMQLATGQGLEAMTRRLDAYRGEQVGCAYAECFTPMRARGALKPYGVLP